MSNTIHNKIIELEEEAMDLQIDYIFNGMYSEVDYYEALQVINDQLDVLMLSLYPESELEEVEGRLRLKPLPQKNNRKIITIFTKTTGYDR